MRNSSMASSTGSGACPLTMHVISPVNRKLAINDNAQDHGVSRISPSIRTTKTANPRRLMCGSVAINMAVDKGGIVKALIGGASQSIASACNPIQFGCETDVKAYPFDTAKQGSACRGRIS